MTRRILAAALIAALAWPLAGAVHAQPHAPIVDLGSDPPPPKPMRRPRLFISPSGEPFRGDHGLASWFAGADANHDGAIDEAEFTADALRFFHTLDANHDDRLDGFELQAYERDIVPELAQQDNEQGGPQAGGRRGGGGRGGGGGPRGGGGAGGGPTRDGHAGGADYGSSIPDAALTAPGAGREGAARYALLNEAQPVANADENVDGKVSLEEWKHATARRFAHLDKAKTGRLILTDLILPKDKQPKDDKRGKDKPPGG
jgi:hypothetical protein